MNNEIAASALAAFVYSVPTINLPSESIRVLSLPEVSNEIVSFAENPNFVFVSPA